MTPRRPAGGVEGAAVLLRAGAARRAVTVAKAAFRDLTLANNGGSAPDIAAQVECLVVIARSHQALGDLLAARAALQHAQQLEPEVDDPQVVAGLRGALAVQDRAEGRYPDAYRGLREALAEVTTTGGRDDLIAASLLNDLAVTCKHLARFDEAEVAYHQAKDILERHLGPHSPEIAAVWHNLAGLAHSRADYRTAETYSRGGLAIRIAALGEDHLDVAADRAALGPILDALGRSDEAEQLLHQALAVFERDLGTEHYEVAVTLHNLGAIHHRRGQHTAAVETYGRSLRIRAATLGEHHPELATTLVNLAVLEQSLGDDRSAAIRLRRAIALLEPTVPDDHPTLTAAREELDLLTSS